MKKFVALTCCLVMLGSACQEEQMDYSRTYDAEIKFDVPGMMSVTSRASEKHEKERTVGTVIGSDTIYLTASKKERCTNVISRTDATGVPMKEFHVDAFGVNSNGIIRTMDDVKVSVTDKVCSYNPVAYWPENMNLDIFAWAAVKNDTAYSIPRPVISHKVNENGTLDWNVTLSYSLEKSTEGKMQDAEKQPDIMFACKKAQNEENAPVQLSFRHALAAVEFKVGSMPQNTRVNRISLKRVKDKGICTIQVDEDGQMEFNWETADSETTVAQDMEVTVGGNGKQEISDNAKTFFLIPQEIHEDASILIEFTVADHDYQFEAPLYTITSEWECGFMYSYSISLKEYIEVDIATEPQSEGSRLKQNVRIQNTGLTTSFVRVVVNGYWQDSVLDEFGNRIIVMPWSLLDEITGKVVWGNSWSQYWIAHTVNQQTIYYYKFPLGPGEMTAVPFIEEYRLTANPPTMDSNLEINIMAQSISIDDVEEAWGVTSTNGIIDL